MTGSSFDRDDFATKVSEIGEMLGEVWAIDELVRWVEANPEGGGAAQPNNGWYPRIEVGEKYPFEYEAPEGSWWPLLTSGRNWGAQVAESVRSLTWAIVRTESATFDDAVGAIRAGVVDRLRTGVGDDFARIDNNLAAWNGDAADAFGDWYGQVEHIARRQTYVAETVCSGIAASKAVVDLGQQSLKNVVDGVHALLDEQLRRRHDSLGLPPENSAFEVLVLGALVFGLLAAIPTGGASVAGTAAALSSAAAATNQLLTYAATQVPTGDTRELTASTADEVFHSLSDSINQVIDNVRVQWHGVESTIEELIAHATASADDHLLAPVRPRIVRRGATPDGFHHESAPR